MATYGFTNHSFEGDDPKVIERALIGHFLDTSDVLREGGVTLKSATLELGVETDVPGTRRWSWRADG